MSHEDLGRPVDGSPLPPPAVDELAFGVHECPGGARAALEAVLMVADEPVPAGRLATGLGPPAPGVGGLPAPVAGG